MKSALALDMAIVVSLVVGSVSYFLSGDIYAVMYLFFSLPYLAFFYFGLGVRSWSYLGSSILSALIVVLLVVSAITLVDLSAAAIVTWEIGFGIILFSLNSLVGFPGILPDKEANAGLTATLSEASTTRRGRIRIQEPECFLWKLSIFLLNQSEFSAMLAGGGP